jgi:hypothetical protein
MAVTLYKAGYGRKSPVCAVCLDRTRGLTSKVNVGYGQHVWLCAGHSSREFRFERGGRDFALTLMKIWTASGGLTRLRSLAIDAHLERVRRAVQPPDPRKPGSYSWPELRAEIDERLARGEAFDEIVADVRRRYASSAARLPADRTFRRWRSDPRPVRRPAERRAVRERPDRRPARSLSPREHAGPTAHDDATPTSASRKRARAPRPARAPPKSGS